MLDGADDAAASDGFATVPGRAPERLLLSLSGIVKEFPGVRALSGVDFDLRRGEVHAVCGENGAGKSTLMKIISGVHAPSAGRLSTRASSAVSPRRWRPRPPASR